MVDNVYIMTAFVYMVLDKKLKNLSWFYGIIGDWVEHVCGIIWWWVKHKAGNILE